jgi:hypothetical protein
MPAVALLAEFRQAVADFPVEELEVGAEPAAQAEERSLAESGFLLLGEVHGVWENPLIIAALLRSFGLASLALEWPAELAPVISAFLAGEALADDPQLWSGDGRITAGHLAVLRERAAAGPLGPVLAAAGPASARSGSTTAAGATTTSRRAGSRRARARAARGRGSFSATKTSPSYSPPPAKRWFPKDPGRSARDEHRHRAGLPAARHAGRPGQPGPRCAHDPLVRDVQL